MLTYKAGTEKLNLPTKTLQIRACASCSNIFAITAQLSYPKERVLALSSYKVILEVFERTAKNACLVGIKDAQLLSMVCCEYCPH
jgi:hypothetical protein